MQGFWWYLWAGSPWHWWPNEPHSGIWAGHTGCTGRRATGWQRSVKREKSNEVTGCFTASIQSSSPHLTVGKYSLFYHEGNWSQRSLNHSYDDYFSAGIKKNNPHIFNINQSVSKSPPGTIAPTLMMSNKATQNVQHNPCRRYLGLICCSFNLSWSEVIWY